MIEKYGAIVLINQIIKTLYESKDKVPGINRVIDILEKSANEINEEIYREFTGTINNLAKYVEENADDV